MTDHCLIPDWNAPATVQALSTTRRGGCSAAPYVSLNLGQHVGDDPLTVAANRQRLRQGDWALPADPLWLRQVHGTQVVALEEFRAATDADACIAHTRDLVCAVLSADCMPLLLCDDTGSVVGAVHAGWRGLAAGVIEACVAAMAVAPARLLVWLGPAIGPRVYEVGDEVRAVFCARDAAAELAFVPSPPGKWLCDLYLLARQRLVALGVERISGGEFCTYSDVTRFYSYRRDGVTGRMASCIWLGPARTDQTLAL